MRVFVSYSFIDKELYLLTLLVSKLREKGYYVQLSDNNYLSNNYIINSDYFVGLITNQSQSINSVFNEFQTAEKLNKNRVLLIEQGVVVNQNNIKYILFDRNDPEKAIQQLFNEKEKSKRKPVKQSSSIEEIVKAGAIIAGVAALLSLLSNGNENKK